MTMHGARRFQGRIRGRAAVCAAIAGLLVPAMLYAPVASAGPVEVPNPSFEDGDDGPDGWHLDAGDGVWLEEGAVGRRSLGMRGTGEDAAESWLSDPIAFAPNKTYRLSYQARLTEGAGGSIFAGPVFANRDNIPQLDDAWTRCTQHFAAPSDPTPDQCRLRFGTFNIGGLIAFDDVEIVEVQPVYRSRGGVSLGDGERIEGDRYTFDAPFSGQSANQARPLDGYKGVFNTPRWVLTDGDWIAYRHEIDGVSQRSATIDIHIGYYSGGGMQVEASVDGEEYLDVGVISDVGNYRFALPEALFPADAVLVRLRAATPAGEAQSATVGGSLQVYRYMYSAELDRSPGDFAGSTSFLVIDEDDARVDVAIEDIGEARPGKNVLRMRIRNLTDEALSAAPKVSVEMGSGERTMSEAGAVALEPDAEKEVSVDYEIPDIGDVSIQIAVAGDVRYQAETAFYLAPLYAQNYGAQLPASSEETALWWASSGWKIDRDRAVPEDTSPAMRLSLACNEHEAAQLVVRPEASLTGVRLTPEALTNAQGDVLAADNVELLQVGYVTITRPTDNVGSPGRWPDPLPPIDGPLDLAPGANQPFWVCVHAPKGTPAGVYTGAIRLEADGWDATVPLEVEVYDFELPDRMTCQTALGFDGPLAKRYHGVKSPEDTRKLADLYAEALAKRRISIFELTDPIIFPELTYTWPNAPEPGVRVPEGDLDRVFRPEFDWASWDAEMTRLLDTYHFNTFVLLTPGLGGGAGWSGRADTGVMLGYTDDMPEYRAAFRNWYHAVQEHLREKGWLEMAYIFWFDEPVPEQYDFVMKYNLLMKEAAPDLQRMLSDRVKPELIGGPNLWCALVNEYDHEEAMAQRARSDDRFWWYVCTGPKAPYVTLFMDHPATEMRVWLWQTWQRELEGILEWATNYWTSNAAYPDSLQDPYEDPMSWTFVIRNLVGRGTRVPWGNGDGRFLYPPVAVADGNPDAPVLEPPVASIRLEMLRDGLEDFEYLVILRDLVEQAEAEGDGADLDAYRELLETPAEITTSTTQFTWDPAPIEAHREKVARAIASLRRMLD